MRRFMTVVYAVTMLAALSASSFAFTTRGTNTVTAGTVLSSAGSVSVSIQLKNTLDNSTTGWIWWNPASVTVGSTQWLAANAYVVIHSTITDSTGGIQIYTDNRNASANPRYVGVTGTDPAGLVGYSASDATASSTTLSMCWRIVDQSTTTLTIRQTGDTLYSNELGSAYPCFLWMKDVGTSGFVNGEDYITMKESARGLQHAESTFGVGCASPDYLYFGANFTSAVTPRTYKTNRLIIEAYTD